MFSAADQGFMARALQLAQRGLYSTTPNPRVGCVLVRNGQIIGEGWHLRAGEAHAEVMAIRDAGARARGAAKVIFGGTAPCASAAPSATTATGAAPPAGEQGADNAPTRGATAYVTLEPCAHVGRTPPCTDALLQAGIARVVAAMADPNRHVVGQGLQRLQTAGVATACGLLEAQARELNIGFVTRMEQGRPWLRLKAAISLDGKTALANGRSQWITGAAARAHAQTWRARSCAMLTGYGTVRDDNPRLSVRGIDDARQPLRVVIDSRLQTAPDAAILAGGGTLIFAAQDHPGRRAALLDRGAQIVMLPDAAGKVDLLHMRSELAQRGINEVLVEAGMALNGSLLEAGCVDELLLYQAPLILGDGARGMARLSERQTLDEALAWQLLERRAVGDDCFMRLRPTGMTVPR